MWHEAHYGPRPYILLYYIPNPHQDEIPYTVPIIVADSFVGWANGTFTSIQVPSEYTWPVLYSLYIPHPYLLSAIIQQYNVSTVLVNITQLMTFNEMDTRIY
jgi:hypothetical protein